MWDVSSTSESTLEPVHSLEGLIASPDSMWVPYTNLVLFLSLTSYYQVCRVQAQRRGGLASERKVFCHTYQNTRFAFSS